MHSNLQLQKSDKYRILNLAPIVQVLVVQVLVVQVLVLQVLVVQVLVVQVQDAPSLMPEGGTPRCWSILRRFTS